MASEYTVETLITDTFGTYLAFLENVDAGFWVVYGFVMVLIMMAVFSFGRKAEDEETAKRIAAREAAWKNPPRRKLTAEELAAMPAPWEIDRRP